MKVIKQEWLGSERGWGCRDDGYSLHLTKKDLVQYIVDYWSKMPKETPDEYSRPYGDPQEIDIDEETYNGLLGTTGKRFF